MSYVHASAVSKDPAAAESPSMAVVALRSLASLKLTVAVIVALGAGALATANQWLPPTWALAAPLFVFALNLGAAVLTHPAFRRNLALLVFHLGLIAIVALAACARLTYLEGIVELTIGEEFSAAAVQATHGPLHANRLHDVRFRNEGFDIQYDEAMRRIRMRNTVLVAEANAKARRVEIGDNVPLVHSGYRILPTSNKGFAPVFTWLPSDPRPSERGSVHLPSYPLHEYRQALEWTLGGQKLWTMLQFDEVLLKPGERSQFRLPSEHRLIVRIADRRYEIQPGEHVQLASGTLRYEGLSAWMGYSVSADWTKPWLLAACLVAALSLAWHFWRKFVGQPWLRSNAGDSAVREAQP